MTKSAWLLSVLFATNAGAATLDESFDSRAQFASGTAIWNQSLGKIHPSLYVTGYGGADFPVSVGDGSDGPFNNLTYGNFGAIVGSHILIDTTLHPVLHVTDFTLDAGMVIEPIGGNPLIIESLKDVVINGEIWCQGHDASNAVPGTKGLGRCGGTAGGNGGAAGGSGQAGTNSTAPVTGGGLGNYILGTPVGGGGGGSWSNPLGLSPPDSGANGVNAGTSFDDSFYGTIAGSAGGGGGAGDAVSVGGGGGGGGGTVIIRAVGDITFGVNGYIYANGGNGADSVGGGGSGGGGGGGSVQIFVGGGININNLDLAGASQANGGLGGTSGRGAGGIGRNWLTCVFFNGPGGYSPTEAFPLIPGAVKFSNALENVITNSYDLGSNLAQVISLTFLPASADFLFEVSGSSDNFASDNTGWTTNPAVVSNKRYLKMRLNITTSNQDTPTMIDTAKILYVPGQMDDFEFKSAGCGRVDSTNGPMMNLILLLITPLLLIALKIKAHRQLARQ